MMERGGLLLAEVQIDHDPCLRVREHPRHTHHLPATQEATQGKILSQSQNRLASDYGGILWEMTKETIYLPLG